MTWRRLLGSLLIPCVAGCIAPIDEVHPSGSPPNLPAATASVAAPSRSPLVAISSAAPVAATPEPSVPDGLEQAAAAEQDGVRFAIELERNPMPAGKPTWARATVTNTGRDALTWLHDGCNLFASIGGTVDGAAWRSGDTVSGALARWKASLLGPDGHASDAVAISFTPESFIGKGTVGCDDVGMETRVAPGASIRARLQWNGLGYPALAPPPTGRVDLLAEASFFWRAKDGQPDNVLDHKVDLHLQAWVSGDGQPWLHPGEAVDAAFGDPQFVGMLLARSPGEANQPLIRFDPASGHYVIGIVDFQTSTGRLRFEVVDGLTGSTLGYGERNWDFRTDGNP